MSVFSQCAIEKSMYSMVFTIGGPQRQATESSETWLGENQERPRVLHGGLAASMAGPRIKKYKSKV